VVVRAQLENLAGANTVAEGVGGVWVESDS